MERRAIAAAIRLVQPAFQKEAQKKATEEEKEPFEF